ncbi:hypothetical protein QF012_002359 [Pseudomonas laurylsulfatiphila]
MWERARDGGEEWHGEDSCPHILIALTFRTTPDAR